MTAVFVLAGVSVAGGIVCFFAGKHTPIKFTLKTFASLVFVLAGFVATLANPSNLKYGILITIALVLGLLGDIFLALGPFSKDKASESLFMLTGGLCFGAGHIFLLVIFLTQGAFNYLLLLGLLVLPAVFIFLCKVPVIKVKQQKADLNASVSDDKATVPSNTGNEVAYKRVPILGSGKLLIPMLIYSLLLGAMAVSAINIYVQEGGIRGILLIVAAICFVISDTSLAIANFAPDELPNKRNMMLPVMLFYYVAQALFAVSILY